LRKELIYNAFVNRIMDAVERGGHEIMGVYVDVLVNIIVYF